MYFFFLLNRVVSCDLKQFNLTRSWCFTYQLHRISFVHFGLNLLFITRSNLILEKLHFLSLFRIRLFKLCYLFSRFIPTFLDDNFSAQSFPLFFHTSEITLWIISLRINVSVARKVHNFTDFENIKVEFYSRRNKMRGWDENTRIKTTFCESVRNTCKARTWKLVN